MAELRAASIALGDTFIRLVEQTCPMLKLASPRDGQQRGSQVSFHFDQGYAAMQACIDKGVIGDFRAPDIMRFGFTPLFIDQSDVQKAADILADVMTRELWRDPKYQARQAVT